jgi:hypothetical protein
VAACRALEEKAAQKVAGHGEAGTRGAREVIGRRADEGRVRNRAEDMKALEVAIASCA